MTLTLMALMALMALALMALALMALMALALMALMALMALALMALMALALMALVMDTAEDTDTATAMIPAMDMADVMVVTVVAIAVHTRTIRIDPAAAPTELLAMLPPELDMVMPPTEHTAEIKNN